MIDKIFVYNWSGDTFEYRFLFSKASINPFDVINEIELPPGCLQFKSWKRQLKRMLGMSTADEIEFTLNVSDIPLDFDNEFIDIIKNPILPISYSCNYASRSVSSINNATYNGQFNAGTLIRLQCKYSPSSNWETVFSGALRGESGYSLDNSNVIMTFSAVSVFKIILDNTEFIALDLLRDFNEYPTNYAGETRDLIYNANSTNYYISHLNVIAIPGGTGSFGLTPGTVHQLDLIFDFIEQASQKMYRYLLRNHNISFSLDYVKNLYYKQGDSTGTIGASLLSNNIHVLTYDPQNDGGLFNKKDDLGLYKKYNSSAWDFLKDYLTQSFAKVIFNYSENKINWASIYGSHFTTKKIINIDPLISNISSENSDSYIYKASSTFCDIWSDSNFADLDKIEKIQNGSTNENEFAIPIYLNNIPTAITYSVQTKGSEKDAIATKPHVTNLYYKDTFAGFDVLARCHEYLSFTLDNTLSGYIVNYSPIDYDQVSENLNKPSELCSIIQEESGWGYYAANKMLELFGDKLTQEVTLELPVDFNFQESEGWLLQWMDTVYIIDNSLLDPRMSNEFQEFYPIEWEWDFDKDIIKLKLLQRRNNAR